MVTRGYGQGCPNPGHRVTREIVCTAAANNSGSCSWKWLHVLILASSTVSRMVDVLEIGASLVMTKDIGV
jgi:hypothetical protein